jgi:flagellum-specific peptidoglycan hydrolase FlgJ
MGSVSATQIANFIERIAPCAQYAYKLLGKVKPSVCIGMACCECGYGTAGSVKYHSYLGHKVGSGKTALKYWDGTFVNLKTKEEYTVGVHTAIVDAFRTYKDMQQCVLNFYELLNTSLYSRVTADADYRTQMKQIKACGYMTSSTEVNTVITIIEKYNLTKYDFNSGTPEYPVPTRTLKKGMRGEDVKWLQWELKLLNYPVGNIDGIYGPKTEQCVKDYQTKVFVDGIVGQLTLSKLTK